MKLNLKTLNAKKLLPAIALGLSAIGAQATAVLTFEGLPTDPNFSVPFTSNFGGLKFGNNDLQTNDWAYDDYVTPYYQPHSGTVYAQVVTAVTGDPFEAASSITSASEFAFSGAWFSGFGQIYYELKDHGVTVQTTAPSDYLSATPTFVDAQYGGLIDEIVVHGQLGYFVMDDVTVPEPGSLALVLLAGTVGVGAARRRPAARKIA